MTFDKLLARPMVAVLAFALCGGPEALAQTQQQSTTPAPQTSTSQDAAQQPIEPSQQQTWPTQESAPSTTAPSTTNTVAPDTTKAPDTNAQQPAPTQPTQPATQDNQRVVLSPEGQAQPAPQNRGTKIDPSAGPLTVPPSTQSAAPTANPEDQTKIPAGPTPQANAQQTQQPAAKQPPSPEPLGTAAAEGVNTAGNGASKPAGSAIAPAKQNRKRSLLIKLGAIAAAGVAVGTVAALSRKTPGNPPNTGAAATTGR